MSILKNALKTLKISYFMKYLVANKKGIVNILIISFLLLGIIFSFLVLISTLNIFVNRFNYEYLYGNAYVADSYIVRFYTSTGGKIIIKNVPYNFSDPIINFGSSNLNGSLVEVNVYTVDVNSYRQLKFYINYSGGIVEYYQLDKAIVY
jgi:hypothetical protein